MSLQITVHLQVIYDIYDMILFLSPFLCDMSLQITVHLQVIYDIYDMIYLLTAIGLTPGGVSTVHTYTKQYSEQHF